MRWKHYVMIVMLLLMNFMLIFRIYYQRNEFEKKMKDAYIYNLYFDLLLNNIKMDYNYNNTKIYDFKIKDHNDRELSFSSLLDEKYKLFLVYSHQNCLSCVSSAIKELIDFSKTIDSDRVAIIGEYSNIRELKAYMNEKNINFPIYFVKENNLPILQKENVPYVF